MRTVRMQHLVTRLERAFAAATMNEAARGAVSRVFAAAAEPGQVGPANGETLAVTGLFPAALNPLTGRADALGDLALALQDMAPDLVWTTRKSLGPTASDGFADAHANCLLIGPGGMESRQDIWIGLSLMAPGTRYPDHDHAPQEVYLVLSPGQFWHGDAAWITPGLGGTVHNVPGIRHAMRAQDAPFLAIWVLPV